MTTSSFINLQATDEITVKRTVDFDDAVTINIRGTSITDSVSISIDRDRLPELIFKLQACAPDPSIESIRLRRHITEEVGKLVDHTILTSVLRNMGHTVVTK